MGNYVVYVHQNRINGKRYIGITNNTLKRWCGAGKRYQQCPRFWSAIQKYGWENFTHEVLETGLTLEEANMREQFYIAKYRSYESTYGYNLTTGGECNVSMLGKHHTEETRKKMSESARGRVISEKQRKQHAETMTGMLVGSRNGKSRPVKCLNTDEVFESQRLAAKAKGVNQDKISLCCQGLRNHTHGFRWEYV